MLWSVPAASAIHLPATNHTEFITLVAVERPSLLMVGNNDEVYDQKPRRYAKDSVRLWLIWSLSNNNKKIRTSYYFVEANHWRTQSIARSLSYLSFTDAQTKWAIIQLSRGQSRKTVNRRMFLTCSFVRPSVHSSVNTTFWRLVNWSDAN